MRVGPGMLTVWSYTEAYLRLVKIVKANLCLLTGSKSFLPNTAGLADERTPTKVSVAGGPDRVSW